MYKGSKKPNIKIFYPENIVADDVGKLKHAGIKEDKVVWVSNKKDYAMAFAMLMGKVKFGMFYRDNKKPILSIGTIDPEKVLNLDEKFYLYELEDAEYIDVMGPEKVSLKPVNVLNVETYTIKDVAKQFEIYKPQKWVI